jgi:hypothetical protein
LLVFMHRFLSVPVAVFQRATPKILSSKGTVVGPTHDSGTLK